MHIKEDGVSELAGFLTQEGWSPFPDQGRPVFQGSLRTSLPTGLGLQVLTLVWLAPSASLFGSSGAQWAHSAWGLAQSGVAGKGLKRDVPFPGLHLE